MGVSSLINLEQTQEENQRKHGNSGAALLSDVLFTPVALIFLNPKDSPWAAAPGQDTGRACSPTDTWSGHRDSPQPYRYLVRTQGQPAAWSGQRDSPQPYRYLVRTQGEPAALQKPGQDTGTARSPTDKPFHPSSSVATRACRGG